MTSDNQNHRETFAHFRMRLEHVFFSLLETKTGWGRLEIKDAFIKAELQVLDEMIETRTQREGAHD